MRKSAGFTVFELLVGIAVLSILVSVAMPGFQSTISDAKQVSAFNKVSSTLRFARSEAVKRSSAVSICGRATDTTCGSDWSNGMLVFLDNASGTDLPLVYDGQDSTLRSILPVSTGINMNSSALLSSTATSPTSTSVIRFDGRGRPNWLNGTIVLCDERGDKHARALIMTGSGITRQAYATTTSNEVVVDARGTAVSCS
ncbi:MAG: GspH/FimT family pseudopilin [Granulosicoccus sp.]